jgi:hypothetical protein
VSDETDPPAGRPWVALTASDLTDLAEELNRLNYTTNARAGVTAISHVDERLIEYRRLPGSTDLVVMVIGQEAPSAPSPDPTMEQQ